MKTKIPSITIGLDLGDKKHAICVLNKAGEIIDERSITNHRESLRRLSQKYPKARIALEVGTHSPWTSRLLGELGHDVIVANPRKLRAIYTSNRKSDQTDARMIPRIARIDPELLFPVTHSTETAQRDLLQVKLRDNLVRQRVDMTSEEIKAVVVKSYAKAECRVGPWSGGTGSLGCRLDDRFSFTIAAHTNSEGKQVVSKDARIYVYDWQHKRRLEIAPYQWEGDGEPASPVK